jgi:hypothetical protein
MNLKSIVITILGVFYAITYSFSQVVTADPEFPAETDAVTIYFDASKGNQELMNFSGDIYAHTGVITNESADNTDWNYVIAGWTNNTEKAKLSKISSNLYSLEITPNIRDFYGVAEDEEILQMAFVFRNSDGTIVGRESNGDDILYDVYADGLNVNITSPNDQYIADLDETIDISASSDNADSMFLFIDEVLIKKVNDNIITTSYTASNAGLHEIKVTAKASNESKSDSIDLFVKGANIQADIPDGWIKGINYLGEDSVGLVLFAPNKEFVFVIGDFTDWRINENFLMNQTPDGEYYWIAIGDLIPNKEYIFQYYIDGEIKIADPYTEQTSDPSDTYIAEATYPGLIDYPTGKTSQIASVIETNQTEYQWKNTSYDIPKKNNLIIYELLIRDFIAKHDYKTLIDTLDYLDTLGINAIELMPFNEFEGNESWGYNPSFYFAPDKYYGPKEDLKEFIDSCHSRGIAVIMDMVLNHSYGQSPLVRMYFDGSKPTSENPWYNVESPNSAYSWGYDFNHESAYTKEFVDSVNSFWMVNYKVDGFRFDFTKGFTNTQGDGWAYDNSRINILKRMALKIWDVNPNAYVILEHLTENSEEKNLAEFGIMLWGNINYEYNEATMGYSSDIDWASYKERGWSNPNLIAYMESHDEERLMYKNLQFGNSTSSYNIKNLYTGLHRIELAANFFIPIPGPKMIWQFGELGYDYSIDYECRVCNKPIRWDYFTSDRRKLYYVFKELNNLKTSYDVFSTDNYTITQNGMMKSIHLYSDDMVAVILGNFDVESGDINPQFPSTGDWYEFYTGDTLNVNNTEDLIILDAGEYRIYTNSKLYEPNIPTTISSIEKELTINVFPNPSSDYFYFQTDKNVRGKSQIKVFDIHGKLVKSLEEYSDGLIELNASDLAQGMYLFRLNAGGKIYSGKLFKE